MKKEEKFNFGFYEGISSLTQEGGKK